ncbi:MAG: HepT-like ribonuclease domain-containing protein, partial [Bacteroidota bacterium]
NKVPNHVKGRYSNLPWKSMYGLRNFATHEYHITDPAILWDIIQNNLVQNRLDLEALLEGEKGN